MGGGKESRTAYRRAVRSGRPSSGSPSPSPRLGRPQGASREVHLMAVKHRSLLAFDDLHVEHPENREIVSRLEPSSEDDWLIVCGDVANLPNDIEWALRLLRERFATVIWVPGNRE